MKVPSPGEFGIKKSESRDNSETSLELKNRGFYNPASGFQTNSILGTITVGVPNNVFDKKSYIRLTIKWLIDFCINNIHLNTLIQRLFQSIIEGYLNHILTMLISINKS